MRFTIETEQEEDGRWIAEVLELLELPGAMKYGGSRAEATAQAEALALRVLAERIEAGEQPAEPGEEVERLSEEEIERLEDEYDVARAQEVRKGVEEGRMELVSGEELRRELDRICAEADEEEELT